MRQTCRRQIVNYPTAESAGTVVIDTPHTSLYYVLGGGRAIRYGIGVGREGFTWSGTQTIARKAEWPDWTPPAEMIARQPYLPRFMAGGPSNPLGARAMYLGDTNLSHPRNQRSADDRNARVQRLHPAGERRRDGSLLARQHRHKGRRAPDLWCSPGAERATTGYAGIGRRRPRSPTAI